MATLGQIDAIIEDKIRVTRPASQIARYAAINRGYRMGIDTIIEVRPEWFFEEHVATLPANRLRVPIQEAAETTNPVRRIKHLVAFGSQDGTLESGVSVSSDRIVTFTHRTHGSEEWRVAELMAPGDTGWIFYDLLFPGGVPTLALAPALSSPLKVLLGTIYSPSRLTAPEQVLEVLLGDDFQELAISGAMEWLLRDVNDVEGNRYGEECVTQQAKLAAYVSTVSEQSSQHMGSALWLGDV